jgi:hypothetical protein
MTKFMWRLSYIFTMMRLSYCSYTFAAMCADSWLESFGMEDYSGSDAAIEEMSYWSE